MTRIQVILEADVEALLRSHVHYRGDLSRLVNEAIRKTLGPSHE